MIKNIFGRIRDAITSDLARHCFIGTVSLRHYTAITLLTHDKKILPAFKRIYHIRDGRSYEEAGEGRPFE